VTREFSAGRLLSLHNLFYTLELLRRLRRAIAAGRFESEAAAILATRDLGDPGSSPG
jgi:queuine/archaeosine tRNA-ribosyltransferase